MIELPITSEDDSARLIAAVLINSWRNLLLRIDQRMQIPRAFRQNKGFAYADTPIFLARDQVFGNSQWMRRSPIFFALFLLAGTAVAQERTSGDWTFTVNEAGEGEIYSYLGKSQNLVIPAEIEGVPIKHIGREAFLENDILKSVVIPDGVKTIGNQAFHGCDNIASVRLGKSIEVIDDSAFRECLNLESIHLPDTLTTIGDAAFDMLGKESKLSGIEIPPNVRTIGSAAFRDCAKLTSVTIPKGVTVIDAWTFSGCQGLTNVVIPEGVTEIAQYAFENCSGLTSLHLPSGVTNIGMWAFGGCNGLKDVTIPESVATIGVRAFADCGQAVQNSIPRRFEKDIASIMGTEQQPSGAAAPSMSKPPQPTSAVPSITIGDATYQNVVLQHEYPLSLFIKHDSGMAFLNRSDLSKEQVAALLGTISK